MELLLHSMMTHQAYANATKKGELIVITELVGWLLLVALVALLATFVASHLHR